MLMSIARLIYLIIHNGREGEVYSISVQNEMMNIDFVKIICSEMDQLPKTKFAGGIKKTIQWYLDNREWWEEIISGEYRNYYEKMYGNRG